MYHFVTTRQFEVFHCIYPSRKQKYWEHVNPKCKNKTFHPALCKSSPPANMFCSGSTEFTAVFFYEILHRQIAHWYDFRNQFLGHSHNFCASYPCLDINQETRVDTSTLRFFLSVVLTKLIPMEPPCGGEVGLWLVPVTEPDAATSLYFIAPVAPYHKVRK
uniref:Uncharacterized protein n=1 Tax=Arion vulgaris TaxID=1028688 RepID=A0A0B6ZR29_9EUPU